MSRKKISINSGVLEDLYLRRNLSPYKIAGILNCSFTTISNRLREYSIPLKSPSFARMRYAKYDFDEDLVNKAYIIGFRIGDLNVYKPTENSETIIVRCHTTQYEQVEVMKSLFESFGHVQISCNKQHFHVNCYLNGSFDFLLDSVDDMLGWIKKRSHSLAFIAGYVDAEANLIINQGKARFKIDAYDKEVLQWISNWLSENNIENKLGKIYKRGQILKWRKPFRKDLWRLNINHGSSIERFLLASLPYLKHSKRIADAKLCLENVKTRRKNGTI
ncbi:MAG: LAGLIDADG family homing endonuclease [Parcubacteria group bacterium]